MTRYEDSFVLKDEVSKSLIKINNSLEAFNGKLKGSEVQLAAFQKKTESIRNLGKGMQDFGNKMTVGVTLPIIGAMTYASKMGMEFQDAEMRLQTMLGSAEKGTEMFNKIVEMGAKTPFEARDLLNATNTMLGFGVAQERVLPLMMQLGDISAGNRERFQQLALAFSQVSAAGKLQGQDLLQMINAGFNPLEQIAKRTGKTVGYWKDEMSKGNVTVAMVEQAMKDATSEGGRFNGMMDKMSKTASGKLSTMLDNFNTAMAQLGQVLLPYVTKGIEAITAALEKFTKLSPGTQKMILLFGGIAAAIGPLLSGFGSLIIIIANAPAALAAMSKGLIFLSGGIKAVGIAILSLSKGFIGLLANPVTWWVIGITAAVAALVAGIVLLYKNWDKIWGAIKSAFAKVADFITGKISALIGYVNGLIDKLGILAYFIPGLKAIKITKDISNGIAARNNSNSYRQSSIRNTTNNTTTNNNFYGNMSLSGSSILNDLYNSGMNTPLYAR